jgi:hypothetical protein
MAAHGMSRKGLEIPGVDFRIDFLQRLVMLASWSEILFKLLVPGEVVAARDVRSQFCQVLGRQFIDSLFDFRETHDPTLAAAGSIFK